MTTHHPACPQPWEACLCELLQNPDEDNDPYTLACAYGQFYDPDWEANPYGPDEPYGGWSRTYQGAMH